MRKLIFILCLFPVCLFSQVVGKFLCDGNTNDVMGVNNLTAYNTPTYTQGIRGQAIVFNGSNMYAEKTTPSGFPTGDANISVSLWMNTNTATGVRTMCCYGTGSTRQAFAPTNYNNNNTSVACEFFGPDIITGANVAAINKWHHVVVTHVGGVGNVWATTLIYVDGVLIPTTGQGVDGVMNLTAGVLTIGRVWNSNYYYSGAIDEVTWYSVVLTPAYVKNQYAAAKGFFN